MSSTTVFSIHVLTSFLHGYSATLAAKLFIKLELKLELRLETILHIVIKIQLDHSSIEALDRRFLATANIRYDGNGLLLAQTCLICRFVTDSRWRRDVTANIFAAVRATMSSRWWYFWSWNSCGFLHVANGGRLSFCIMSTKIYTVSQKSSHL